MNGRSRRLGAGRRSFVQRRRRMKKLIVSNWISLDGYISGPNGELDWILGDGKLAQYETELMQDVDTTLFGRKTYEQLSQYWSAVPANPQAMDWEKPHAEMIN